MEELGSVLRPDGFNPLFLIPLRSHPNHITPEHFRFRGTRGSTLLQRCPLLPRGTNWNTLSIWVGDFFSPVELRMDSLYSKLNVNLTLGLLIARSLY